MISKLEHISKSYRRGSRCFEVFSDFSLSVKKQELLVLSGRSGSGKSTLLALAGGYLKPDQGTVSFDGQDITAMDDGKLSQIHVRDIGYLPQSNVMASEFTILENVLLKFLMSGKNEGEAQARELLELLGIAPLAERFPHELSGGELRRVAIARLLISEPKLYLIDEPSGGLDKEMIHTVMKYLTERVHKGGTVIVATHDDLVKEYGSRILEIEERKA